MFISVIMVGYNAEQFLPNALHWILAQNYKDYELIFIDNGSTDSTQQIIIDFQNHHPEINLQIGIIEDNDGLPKGRNLGLSMARGEYVIFHDVDDWMDFDCLSVLAETACNTKAERIIQQIRYVNEDKETIGLLTYSDDASRWSKNTLQGDLFLRKVIKNNRLSFAREAFFDDFYFVNTYNCVSNSTVFINETHYNMTMRDHSLTHKKGVDPSFYPAKLEDTFIAMKCIKEHIQDNHELSLYEYNCIQIYYYNVFHCVEMSIQEKTEQYTLLRRIMRQYYPDYLSNRNIKLFRKNGYRGHFKRNIWISSKAEQVDSYLHGSCLMSFILLIYHMALRTGLYRYSA